MKAADIMTTDIVRLSPGASLSDAIRMMLSRGISGLPVVDNAGRIVGMVTEGDLMRRAELGTGRPHSAWREFFATGRVAGDFVQEHGRKLADIMTREVVVAEPDTTLTDIVAAMERHHIKRLPVVSDGRLVGIVSRADLLRALAHAIAAEPKISADDAELARRVRAALSALAWAPRNIAVEVRDGIAHLHGVVFDLRHKDGMRVAAENVPGLREVRDHIRWIEPNSGLTIIDENGETPSPL